MTPTPQDELQVPRVAETLLEDGLRGRRLDLAALSVAALEYPELDVQGCLRALDEYAARVNERAPSSAPLFERIQALRWVLADEEGFRGNSFKYHAPENSFLNRVLERKLGLPIALSVLYIEVARRAGLELYGVNFPGHFIVAAEGDDGPLVVDPFHGGQVLTEDALCELMKEMAPQIEFRPEMIQRAPLETIVARMLANLKRVYLETCDHARALRVVTLLLKLHPDHPGELRARAQVLCALGAYKAALCDVQKCLKISPSCPDKAGLEMAEKALKTRVDNLN